jgi:hypothetical protein
MKNLVTKLNVDMHINDLASFMFIKNKNNAIIELSLGGIQNNKDLFFFCLDLFCKGLVHLFGDNGKVHVDQLTMEQFAIVKQKMSLAGIDVILNIIRLPKDIHVEYETNLDSDVSPPDIKEHPTAINISEIDSELDSNKPMSEYIFKLKMHDIVYNINFQLVHRVS